VEEPQRRFFTVGFKSQMADAPCETESSSRKNLELFLSRLSAAHDSAGRCVA